MLSRFLRTTYWIWDFINGSPIRNEYNDITKIQKGGQEAKYLRAQHLNSILKYATQNCPFYSKYNPNRLQSFPVTNKTILRENFNDIAVAQNIIPGQIGEIHIQHTSGSTGAPFHIPQDTRKRRRRIAELKFFGEEVGFKSHDRLLHLRIWTKWQNKSKIQSIRENIIPFDMSDLGENRLKELCDTIYHKKVKCIRGYASTFDHIAEYARINNCKFPSLKIIIAGSETLQEGTREKVNKYLECDIISQYANEENGILGQQHVGDMTRAFYLNHASYIFEVLKLDSDEVAEPGELGRIVLTDLFNYSFPIIRYDTGDLAVMSEDYDEHGYKYFKQLYGRRLDLVYNTSGTPVSPMVLSRVLKNFEEIIQWQFIQKTKDKYIIKITTQTNVFNHPTELIQDLQSYFGQNAEIIVQNVMEIPVLNSGKRKPVICEYAH